MVVRIANKLSSLYHLEPPAKQVPYMLVVGDREVDAGTVSLRTRDGDRMNGLPVAEFKARVTDRIANRSLEN